MSSRRLRSTTPGPAPSVGGREGLGPLDGERPGIAGEVTGAGLRAEELEAAVLVGVPLPEQGAVTRRVVAALVWGGGHVDELRARARELDVARRRADDDDLGRALRAPEPCPGGDGHDRSLLTWQFVRATGPRSPRGPARPGGGWTLCCTTDRPWPRTRHPAPGASRGPRRVPPPRPDTDMRGPNGRPTIGGGRRAPESGRPTWEEDAVGRVDQDRAPGCARREPGRPA